MPPGVLQNDVPQGFVYLQVHLIVKYLDEAAGAIVLEMSDDFVFSLNYFVVCRSAFATWPMLNRDGNFLGAQRLVLMKGGGALYPHMYTDAYERPSSTLAY